MCGIAFGLPVLPLVKKTTATSSGAASSASTSARCRSCASSGAASGGPSAPNTSTRHAGASVAACRPFASSVVDTRSSAQSRPTSCSPSVGGAMRQLRCTEMEQSDIHASE